MYGEVSIDDGTSWTRLNGTVDGAPIWGEGDVEGLTGTSGDDDGDGALDFVDLTYDMNAFAGESNVLFRFSYVTDGGLALPGFFADDVTITADGEPILSNGAEGDPTDDGPWTKDGFVKTGSEYIADYPQRYWIENRQLTGADAGIDNSPYNFGDYTKPQWVEHYPYMTGPIIWYNWDAFTDNNVGGHPGVGLILPIDVRPDILMWPDDGFAGTLEQVRGRIQAYDSPLSLDESHQIALHRPHRDETGAPVGIDEGVWGPLPAVDMFDDVANNYFRTVEGDDGELIFQHGVNLEQTGTQIHLAAMNDLGEGVQSATLHISAPGGTQPTTPTTTEPTPTLPPTGGDNSSALAGIGLGAVLAGGLLVALAARRLRNSNQ
jgi:immune inhibitor A